MKLKSINHFHLTKVKKKKNQEHHSDKEQPGPFFRLFSPLWIIIIHNNLILAAKRLDKIIKILS